MTWSPHVNIAKHFFICDVTNQINETAFAHIRPHTQTFFVIYFCIHIRHTRDTLDIEITSCKNYHYDVITSREDDERSDVSVNK